MVPTPAAGRVRSLLVALTAAIAGVLVLDTTALVAGRMPAQAATSTITVPSHSNTPLRLLKWSGVTWLVFPAASPGPDGPRTLTDSDRAATVDRKGRLHLRLTHVGGSWRGVQLESISPLNYGTYQFVTGSAVGDLAKPAVLGMFVYKSSQTKYTNEIDLEDSRALSGLGYPRDAQYVVQPYYKKHHLHRYAIRRKYTRVIHQFTWRPGKVRFATRAAFHGHHKVLSKFRFHGYDVPQPNNEHVYINLHLHPNRPPGKGSREVILNSYSYRPLK
jgi:hypothetical protein